MWSKQTIKLVDDEKKRKQREYHRKYYRDHRVYLRTKKAQDARKWRMNHPEQAKTINERCKKKRFSVWSKLRASFSESEAIGKTWLLNNGFDFVYLFSEHPNKQSGCFRTHFPFDYYAEKNGESWFIDATIGMYKYIDPELARIFGRFSKMGILFVGKEESCLNEISKKHCHTSLSPTSMKLMKTKIMAKKGVS
jgi:hypothetical protein